MNRSELISEVARLTGSTKVKAEQNVNAVVSTMADALSQGETIRLEGFASLQPGVRASRVGTNPHTGATIQLDPKPYVRVKLHQPMLNAMGQG